MQADQSSYAADASQPWFLKCMFNIKIINLLQSGSLYQLWGWYSSKRDEQRKRKQIRQNTKCPERTTNIFSCFAGMTTEQAFTASIYTTNLRELSWKPTDDNDFFPANISDEDYSPLQKWVGCQNNWKPWWLFAGQVYSIHLHVKVFSSASEVETIPSEHKHLFKQQEVFRGRQE